MRSPDGSGISMRVTVPPSRSRFPSWRTWRSDSVLDGPRATRTADSMTGLMAISRRTFSALAIPNFRRFFFGQSTSLVGTWMQSVAQSWLVFTVTHSPTAIGFVLALQTLPVLHPRAIMAGSSADRVDKASLPDRPAVGSWESRRLCSGS